MEIEGVCNDMVGGFSVKCIKWTSGVEMLTAGKFFCRYRVEGRIVAGSEDYLLEERQWETRKRAGKGMVVKGLGALLRILKSLAFRPINSTFSRLTKRLHSGRFPLPLAYSLPQR